jgi:hypothetical protein
MPERGRTGWKIKFGCSQGKRDFNIIFYVNDDDEAGPTCQVVERSAN